MEAILFDENQRQTPKRFAIFPDWVEYEERKKEIQQINLSATEYEQAIRDLTDEFGL